MAQKDVIEKIKRERQEEYTNGTYKGNEFAEKNNYKEIVKLVDMDREEVEKYLRNNYAIEGSPEFIDGFIDVLKEILNKSGKE